MNSSTIDLSPSERQRQQQEQALKELEPLAPLQQSESRRITEERSELAVYNNSSEFAESGSSSVPAEPSLPPSGTNTDKPQRGRRGLGQRDFSQDRRRPPLLSLSRTLALARKIDDLESVTYPEGIKTPLELNQGQTQGGKYKYGRDFLLQFMQVYKDKPGNFSNLDGFRIERGPENVSGPSFGSVGSNQRSRMGSMGAPPSGRSASGSIGLGLTGFPGGKGSAPFVMGNFSSTPLRMTSEQRFAASTRNSASSSDPGLIRGLPSNPSGVGGISGPDGNQPSPRERKNRTRSQRGRKKSNFLQPDALRPSEQEQPQAPSEPEQTVPLYEAEDRWTPTARSKLAIDENSPEYVERKVKALLNKLTLENFDSVSNQIIVWSNKSENEKYAETLILVTNLVFEKAIDEELWSEAYARLCRRMMEQISQNVQDDSIRNNAGEPIVGGHLFRKYLLNICLDNFERGWSRKESAQAAAALKPAKDRTAEGTSNANGENGESAVYSDEYDALLKARRQGLGLVRFIGELFKLQMLTERIMHECIKKLLSKVENPEEEEIESLCKLLTTVGQTLDTPKAKGHMNIYFGRIQMLAQADNPNIGWKIRPKLVYVIELRKRNWRPKNETAGPSMIARIHEQDAKNRALAAQQASNMVPVTRGGWQRGGRGQPEQGPDGWNVAGPTPVRAPAKAGDLSNFGRFTASTGPLKTKGPSSAFTKGDRGRNAPPPGSSVAGPTTVRAPVKAGDLSNFGRFTASTGPLKTMGPSSAFKKGDRGRDIPPPGSSGSLSRAASGGNMYSLLGGGGADPDTMPKRTPSGRGTTRKASVDQAPQQAPDTPLRKKLALLPRTVSSTNTNEDSAGDEDKPESDEEQAGAATKSYTDKEATAKAEEDVKEFFNMRDVSEGEKSFAELPDEHKSKLVDKLASKALELKESDVKLVADLFERAASKGCPPSAFEDGLSEVIEFLDDMVIDVPQAYSFMARLLRGARLPQEAVESLGDKIFVDGDPLVKPKDKLLKAYNALA
ncbi:hypothetical protein FRC00_004038 [Tulasnella sp. 408]|nr:hypothetical protein FRC00_004038 [Tulasnella sp. 408]